MKLQLVCLLLFEIVRYIRSELLCLSGTRLHTTKDGRDTCTSCEDGVNYISERQHSHRKCHACTPIINPDLEIIVSNCTRTRDTVILCKRGYYRIKARNGRDKDECVKCRECTTTPARECQGYHDTMCCPHNYDAVLIGDEYLCKERPVLCGPGYFFKEISNECFPCPEGTYMSMNVHKYTQCLKCEVLLGNLTHAVIIRSCNKTSPSLFGCEPGYYRDPGKESLQIEATCSPCQKCDQQLKECGMFHDTICGIYSALVKDTDNSHVSDKEDLRKNNETDRNANLQVERQWVVKKYEEVKDDVGEINSNNLQCQNLCVTNTESTVNNQEMNNQSNNVTNLENLSSGRLTLILTLSAVAFLIQAFILYIAFCVLKIGLGNKLQCMKLRFITFTYYEIIESVLLTLILQQEIVLSYIVFCLVAEADNPHFYIIFLVTTIVTVYNAFLFIKTLKNFEIIHKRDEAGGKNKTYNTIQIRKDSYHYINGNTHKNNAWDTKTAIQAESLITHD